VHFVTYFTSTGKKRHDSDVYHEDQYEQSTLQLKEMSVFCVFPRSYIYEI